jgi:hypothetical protein
MGQKFEAVRVTEETHQQAKFLAEKSGKSISKVVSELVGCAFQIGCTFSQLNLSYEYEISTSRVTIQVEGSNNLVLRDELMPKEVLEEESRHPALEVIVKPKPKKVNKEK